MHILFWSGGKDSYLSYLYFFEDHPESKISLLTTFDQTDQSIPYQGLELKDVREQYEHLNGADNLVEVGLPSQCPNEIYLQRVDQAIKEVSGDEPVHLYFGDWHNADIREWREEQFTNLGYTCHFPIWHRSLHELLPKLLFHPVTTRISWVDEDYQTYLKVGEPYNQRLVTSLPDEIDPMGENGEFHTVIEFQEFPDDPMKRKVL
ncbi:MAG: hypothetical protein ACQETE_08995 [Bacteroidota bacterium]